MTIRPFTMPLTIPLENAKTESRTRQKRAEPVNAYQKSIKLAFNLGCENEACKGGERKQDQIVLKNKGIANLPHYVTLGGRKGTAEAQ